MTPVTNPIKQVRNPNARDPKIAFFFLPKLGRKKKRKMNSYLCGIRRKDIFHSLLDLLHHFR
jgi:hypothetical protein